MKMISADVHFPDGTTERRYFTTNREADQFLDRDDVLNGTGITIYCTPVEVDTTDADALASITR